MNSSSNESTTSFESDDILFVELRGYFTKKIETKNLSLIIFFGIHNF